MFRGFKKSNYLSLGSMMQKMMQFIIVVCFVILACRALSYDALPNRCFPPEEDPRCRAYIGRYFYNTSTRVCEKVYGCWGGDYGYRKEGRCNRLCKVN
uniref:Putative salivary kunitz domain protein n=1 Tax=Ixodes ricinus TaxID=34613 RepID=A0A0K8REA2_IXORI